MKAHSDVGLPCQSAGWKGFKPAVMAGYLGPLQEAWSGHGQAPIEPLQISIWPVRSAKIPVL